MQNGSKTKNKLRVGFIFSYTNNRWLGGYNYFRNLFSAIAAYPQSKIDPVIFVGRSTENGLPKEFSKFEIVKTRLVDRWSPLWFLRNRLI